MVEDVEVERAASRQEVATVLRTLADGVARGRVTVEGEGDSLQVSVPDELAYEVELETEAADEAHDDGVAVELEVELEWLAGDEHGVAAPTVASAEETAPDEESEAANVADEPVAEAPEDTPAPDHGPGAGEEATAAAVEPGDVESLPVGAGGDAGSKARFELFTDRGGEWRWRLLHDNLNVIATGGEGYTRKANARKGLESVRTNSPGADVVEIQTEE